MNRGMEATLKTRPDDRRARPTRYRALAAAMALPLAGCFTYQPVQTLEPVRGDEVRIELTGAGRDRLEATSGLPWDRLEGRLLESDPRDLTMMVRISAARTGFGSQDYVDTLRIPRTDVREVGVKTLSTSRSLLAAGGAIAAAAGAYALFSANRSGGSGGEGGEQFSVLSVLRLLRDLGALVGR